MCSPESELTVEPIWTDTVFETVLGTVLDAELTAQYAILGMLGRGSSAQVKLARHCIADIPVAIKVLEKRKLLAYPNESEVEILKMVDHPNITSLIQVIETEENIYIIQELAEGRELLAWIQQLGFMNENLSRKIFKQLLQAMCYCHDRGIIHRDLKPDNIIIDTAGRVKIIDFGLGAVGRSGEKLSLFCGALEFRAPEFFLSKPDDGPEVDTWSLGIVLYFMTTGTLPFEGTTRDEIGHKVLLGKYHVPDHLSPELKDIIHRLLTVNPTQRPALKNIMEHLWLQHGGEDFTISQCDKRVPSCLDEKILTAMACVGFNPRDIRESLRNKLYDEPMATYSLLQCQAHQQSDSNSNVKPVHPGRAPFPSLEDPGHYPRCPKRIFRSLPLNLALFPSLEDPGHYPRCPKRIFHSLSLNLAPFPSLEDPGNYPRCPKRIFRSLPLNLAPFPSLEDPGNYPRCPKRIFGSLSLNMDTPKDSRQTEQRFRNATVSAISASLQQRTPRLDPVQVLTDQQHDTTDAVQSPRGRWQRLAQRIGAILINLSCCFPVRNMIHKRFNNRVVP